MTRDKIKELFLGAYNYKYDFLYRVNSITYENSFQITFSNCDVTSPCGVWMETVNLPLRFEDYDAFIKESQKNFWKSELMDILFYGD